ncbi:hypothetical protein ACSSZE_17640 [Acidithiobacillus caldus]
MTDIAYAVYPNPKRWQAMAQLQRAAACGWIYFVSGNLPPEKAQNLAAKLDARYGGLYGQTMTRHRADRLKKAHRPRPRLLLAENKDGSVAWWLCSDLPELAAETLADARDKRSRIQWDRFELLRVTKPAVIGGGQNWTWRYRRDVFAEYMANGTAWAAHESPRKAQWLIDYLWGDPGFSGLRTQRLQLKSRMEWQRQRQKPGRDPLVFPPLAVFCPMQQATWRDLSRCPGPPSADFPLESRDG